MASISYDPDRADVDNSGYVSGSVSVSTTQVEAKVGASALASRQEVIIFNLGPQTVYYGPTGLSSSTGIPLFKNSFVALALGPNNQIFLLTASSTSTVIVQELS